MSARVVGYARVSVRGEDVENQVKAIEAYAKEHGLELVGVFRDEAVTGASDPFERPKFQAMYEYCKDNGVSTILIYDLTRLGRSLVAAVKALKRLLEEGFQVYFIRHNIKADLSDPASKVMIYTLLMVAELERDFMKMRQEEAWRQGKPKGRPPKVSDQVIIKYLRKYGGLSKKAIWKIMVGDGLNLSYDQFLRRVKRLAQSKLVVKGG